jgi:hypothetical protein
MSRATILCPRGRSPTVVLVYRYRVHDTTGDDLGTVEHPAPL